MRDYCPDKARSVNRQPPAKFCFLTLLISAASLTSCSSRINAPTLPPQSYTRADNPAVSTEDNSSSILRQSDAEAEATVSKGCVEAWRKGLAGDQEGAIKQLKELDKQYPRVSTVRFMLGQVLERAGKKEEAIKYYRDAVRQSDFDSMHLFKLAEALRTTGDAKGSIPYYRKLLKGAPDFSPGELGLAQALLKIDRNSKEARELIGQVLKDEPQNKEALALSSGIR